MKLKELLAMNNMGIFDFQYNFIDNDTKTEFEDRFKDYYLYREIGFDDPERFLHEVKTKTLLDVDYWAKLYDAFNQVIDILQNVKIDKTTDESTLIDIIRDGLFENENRVTYADMPDQRLSATEAIDIASSITDNSNLSNENNTESNDTTKTATTTDKGLNITQIEAIEMYANKMRDIMSEFIASYDDLFLKVYE